jgi:hypothetical protein
VIPAKVSPVLLLATDSIISLRECPLARIYYFKKKGKINVLSRDIFEK